MVSQTAHLQQSDTSSPDALTALEDLQDHLRRRGLTTWLQSNVPHPYLRIMDGYLAIEYVFAARYDEPTYRWSNVSREHPLDDPTGAADRIVGDLALRLVKQGLARCRR